MPISLKQHQAYLNLKSKRNKAKSKATNTKAHTQAFQDFIYSKPQLELEAIISVRKELQDAIKAKLPQLDIEAIHLRLIALYATFDAIALKTLLNKRKAA